MVNKIENNQIQNNKKQPFINYFNEYLKNKCKLNSSKDLKDTYITYDILREEFKYTKCASTTFLGSKQDCDENNKMCIFDAFFNSIKQIGIDIKNDDTNELFKLLKFYIYGEYNGEYKIIKKSDIEKVIDQKLLEKKEQPIFNNISTNNIENLMIEGNKQQLASQQISESLVPNVNIESKPNSILSLVLKTVIGVSTVLLGIVFTNLSIALSSYFKNTQLDEEKKKQLLITAIDKDIQSSGKTVSDSEKTQIVDKLVEFLNEKQQEIKYDSPTVSLFWKTLAKSTIKSDLNVLNKDSIKEWFKSEITSMIQSQQINKNQIKGGAPPESSDTSLIVKFDKFIKSFKNKIIIALEYLGIDKSLITSINDKFENSLSELKTGILSKITGGNLDFQEVLRFIDNYLESIFNTVEKEIRQNTKTEHFQSLLTNVVSIFLKAVLEKGVYSIVIDLNISQVQNQNTSMISNEPTTENNVIAINNLSITFKKVSETPEITPEITNSITNESNGIPKEKLEPIKLNNSQTEDQSQNTSALTNLSDEIFNKIIERKKQILKNVKDLNEYIHSYYNTEDSVDFKSEDQPTQITKQLNFNFGLLISIDSVQSGIPAITPVENNSEEEVELPLGVKDVTLILYRVDNQGPLALINPTNPKNIIIGDEHVKFNLYPTAEENNDVKQQFMEKLNDSLKGVEIEGGRRFRRNRRSVKHRVNKKTLKKRSGKKLLSKKSNKKAKKYTYVKK